MCNRSTTAFLMEHVKLTHIWPMFPFITSENIGNLWWWWFLVFSGVVKWDNWLEIS